MNTIEQIFDSLGVDSTLALWGNTITQYAFALGVFIALVIVFKIAQWLLLRKLAKLAEKTKTDIDDTIVDIIKSLKPGFYYFIAFFFGVKLLTISAFGSTVINTILLAWIVYQVVTGLKILIDYVISKRMKGEDAAGEGMVHMLANILKGILWVIGGLMILSNIGIDITSLVAGLGIGGIAIALALQNVLSDLFSSFSIYFDKPFEVGDFIVVGSNSGTVEKIGIKTTRLRAMQGEEIVISNQELTSARVQNFKKMNERRISTDIGVTYDTPSDVLEKIPSIIEKVVEEVDGVRFDRAFLTTFADSALVFEFVYYVFSNEYGEYLKAQENMSFKIKREFDKEGIEFAYPTQTLFIQK